MTELLEQLQPSIETIVFSILGILSTIALAGLAALKTNVKAWIDSKTSVNNRELLHKIAKEAFAHAETAFKENGGAYKLEQALKYAAGKLDKIGVELTTEEIKAAIHDACLKYNAEKKKIIQ